MEIVHSDVNIVTPPGYKGEIGFVTFIDDFSRLARIYCIKSKSEVVGKFMHYVNTMSNLMECNVKVLRCDRGSEYLNKHFEDFCSSKGILLNPSPAYVHELNGTAERYNRTVMNRTRCLLSDSGIGKRFWPECVMTAAYLGNRLLANTKEQKTPFEIFFGKRPNISNLKLFGSRVFVRIPDVKRTYKVDPKAEMGTSVGYTDTGYRVLINGVVKESPYVRLAENSALKTEVAGNYRFNGGETDSEGETTTQPERAAQEIPPVAYDDENDQGDDDGARETEETQQNE